MAVAIAAGANADNSNVFSTASLGSPVAGDILVVEYVAFTDGGAPSLTGWQEVGNLVMSGTTHRVAMWYLVLTGAAAGSYTVTRGGGSTFWDGGRIYKLTGGDTATPLTDSGTNSGTTSPLTTGAVVDCSADGALLMVGGTDGLSMTTPSGMTQQFELDGGDAEGWSQVGTALTGATKSSTLGANTGWATVWAAFKAAGGGGGTNPKGIFGLPLRGPLQRVVY